MISRNFKPQSCDLDEDGPESIHRAVALTQLFSASNDLAPQHQAKLAILVEEAVTNIYDHAASAPGFTGSLLLAIDAGRVRVTLTDSGPPFDPREADEIEMPNLERGGGVGLAMIRAWADILDYRSEAGLNRLELALRA